MKNIVKKAIPSPFLIPRWPLPPEIIGNGQRMRTRSRCGRQSTICCLKALFVLQRTCLRYCVCYCLIRNYGRWPCFCEDQSHMINTGYRPDRYCQNLFMMWSLKNTYAVYEWFSIFEDRSANERSPNIKYMFTKSTEAANRDPECIIVFFSFSKTFYHVGSAI